MFVRFVQLLKRVFEMVHFWYSYCGGYLTDVDIIYATVTRLTNRDFTGTYLPV